MGKTCKSSTCACYYLALEVMAASIIRACITPLREELAEEFDEDVELIKETVKYLLDNNMISIESVDLESE